MRVSTVEIFSSGVKMSQTDRVSARGALCATVTFYSATCIVHASSVLSQEIGWKERIRNEHPKSGPVATALCAHVVSK